MEINNTKERKERTLPEVFKELEQQRNNSIRKNRFKSKLVSSTLKFKQHRRLTTKKQGISVVGVFFTIIFIFVLTTSAGNIFASDTSTEIQKVQIENNLETIEIEDIISDNISTTQRKELVTENRPIEFNVTYKENPNLPKDEQVILQAGTNGNKIVTVVKIYESTESKEEIKEEQILNTTITQNPIEQIVEVGTSELLGKFQVHIGDKMYTEEAIKLKDSTRPNASIVTMLEKYTDVKVIGVEGNYVHVEYLNYTGYIDSDLLVSAHTNPEYVEKCRIQKILNRVSFEMDVNKPSGLTLEDFKKVLSNNPRDVNKIFESNAEVFYYLEIKYNINGLLIAAMGIHESAWGTSAIANDKHNLFGYGAYDHDAYNSAFTFTGYQEGIETVAKALTKNYLNPAGTIIYGGETATGKYYNGTTISAINIRYATDDNWGNAVYNIMEGLYEKLQ